jgi:hypothetical protein
MKGRTPVTAVILLLSCLRISALDIAADPYTKTVDFLIDLYGIDENAAPHRVQVPLHTDGGTSEGMGRPIRP